jgi:hypothetical protein
MSLVHDVKLMAGDEIPDRALRARFEALGGHVDEIAAGLRYAHVRGWVEHDDGLAKGTLQADKRRRLDRRLTKRTRKAPGRPTAGKSPPGRWPRSCRNFWQTLCTRDRT